jgi:DNA-binding NarL/FixJ family response regulator
MSSSRTCIIADDHELSRRALEMILVEKLKFDSVVLTGSFDEAVERLEKHGPVTLVLLDLNMPGMHGALSLAAVREYYPQTKVAVVSGSERREDILNALAAGVHGYIPKSLPMNGIMSAIEYVLTGFIYVPSSLAEVAMASGPRSFEAVVPEKVLTQRQREVLQMMVDGKSNKEIARQLGLGEGTVKVHVAAVFRALNVSTRTAAAAAAVALGLSS